MEERDALEEVRWGDLVQSAKLLEGFGAFGPVLSQLEALAGEHGRDQLERIERLATGVYLLEDEADGFVRGGFVERNNRDLVFFENLQDTILEGPELIALCLIAFPKIPESFLPLIPIEDLIDRKSQMLVFPFGR